MAEVLVVQATHVGGFREVPYTQGVVRGGCRGEVVVDRNRVNLNLYYATAVTGVQGLVGNGTLVPG